MHFKASHTYDPRAISETTAEVGMGHCSCGKGMYYSQHDGHFAEEFIEYFKFTPGGKK